MRASEPEIALQRPLRSSRPPVQAAVEGAKEAEAPAPRAQRRSARVLIVDEQTTWSHFVAHGLRRHGHVAVVAESLDRALLLASLYRFDVLVTSVALPDGSGMTLVKKLREENPGLAAIALSDGDADELLLREAGFELYMKKPVPIASLARGVLALALARQEQQGDRARAAR